MPEQAAPVPGVGGLSRSARLEAGTCRAAGRGQVHLARAQAARVIRVGGVKVMVGVVVRVVADRVDAWAARTAHSRLVVLVLVGAGVVLQMMMLEVRLPRIGAVGGVVG